MDRPEKNSSQQDVSPTGLPGYSTLAEPQWYVAPPLDVAEDHSTMIYIAVFLILIAFLSVLTSQRNFEPGNFSDIGTNVSASAGRSAIANMSLGGTSRSATGPGAQVAVARKIERAFSVAFASDEYTVQKTSGRTLFEIDVDRLFPNNKQVLTPSREVLVKIIAQLMAGQDVAALLTVYVPEQEGSQLSVEQLAALGGALSYYGLPSDRYRVETQLREGAHVQFEIAELNLRGGER